MLDLHGPFKESIAKKMLRQIIKGCKDINKDRIVHRDLKLDNIVIFFPRLGSHLSISDKQNIDFESEEFIVKLADFGFAR